MSSNWKSCIVTFIDLVGVKMLANIGTSDATTLMRKMHTLTTQFTSKQFSHHSSVYIWNDSVLLLAVMQNEKNEEVKILKEANALKKKIDTLCESFAISVKGQMFPELAPIDTNSQDESSSEIEITVLKASSYALANCSLIEYKLGRKLKKPWYVDGRIARYITSEQPYTKHKLTLLPRNNRRLIYSYDGDLW